MSRTIISHPFLPPFLPPYGIMGGRNEKRADASVPNPPPSSPFLSPFSVMRRYAELGVDALVTDFPERFVAVRQEGEDALRAAQEASTAAAVAAAAAAATMEGERKRGGEMGREEEKAGGDVSREEEGKDEEKEELQHEMRSCSSKGFSRPSMSSAYPAPLHQPRNRLVNALRQAWPLLRALEGRRGNPHTHTPSTPASNQERRSKLLARQGKEGELKEGTEDGLVMHLKNAARQAEESATAVLQPRLPRRRVQQQQICIEEERYGSGGRCNCGSSSAGAPQTPRTRIKDSDKEEGGRREGGDKEGPMTTTRTTKGKRFPTLVVITGGGEAGRGKERPTAYGRLKDEGGKDDEVAHEWPFLPFERTWAQSSRA